MLWNTDNYLVLCEDVAIFWYNGLIFDMSDFFYFLTVVNYSINFIIYGLSLDYYKKEVLSILGMGKGA